MNSQLDIIIPVYNEADTVISLSEHIKKALKVSKIKYQLYFVDDQSSDKTIKVLKTLQSKHPITILSKKGKQGKAYSILEAVEKTTAPYLAMIDADLQYPPEVIPQMLEIAQESGVAVARRDDNQVGFFRKTMSRTFQWFFGKLLHGLDCDVQSGLKVFKRDIIEGIPETDVTPWTIDIPLLTNALHLGYTIGEVAITFSKRSHGESKIKFISSINEIGGQAIRHKFRARRPHIIDPHTSESMIGAGLIHKGKRFITHTTLHPRTSALHVITAEQKFGIFLVLACVITALILETSTTAKVLVGILSLIYFADVVFNFFLILRSLHNPPEISISQDELKEINDKDLPIYTILCPLYKEAHVIPQFLDSISKLDWPANKLDVQLLLEEDDVESVAAVKEMNVPSYVRVVVVPDSQPKTKPKACNYGLSLATGEYVVIYDAEDAPDPDQLKKSYLAFAKVGPNIKCLQAKLNYYNPNQNWLTRLFTVEYSLWFDVILTGLQSIETTIPLGGTSNHFRTKDLLILKGWDPFNVTEDCDLGVRLFSQGFKTAIIDSTTLEEANSDFKNWLRQRSRWIKGYMQTYLLHMRSPIQLFKQQGIHALLFQLTVGGKIAFILINPILWVLTIAYFALYAYVGPTIEALYPPIVFYMAVISLIFGNFMFIYYYMIGAAKRESWTLMKWIYLVPIYWLMVSIAGAIALYQLIVKPHYWEKTIHGLHLKKKQSEDKPIIDSVQPEKTYQKAVSKIVTETTQEPSKKSDTPSFLNRFFLTPLNKIICLLKDPAYRGGLFLVIASMLSNVINMAASFLLNYTLDLKDFGVFNIFMSLFFLAGIPINALGAAVNYKTSYLLGKYNQKSLNSFWVYIRRRAFLLSLLVTIIWIILIPFLPKFFNTPTLMPFIIFTAVWSLSIVGVVDMGYINGRMMFGTAAILALVQQLVRLLSIVVFIRYMPTATYMSVVIGLIVTLAISYIQAKKSTDDFDKTHEFHIPKDFYFATVIAGFSSIAYFSLDNLLVAHYLSPEDVGAYSTLGQFGKMIFFVGSLLTGFLVPIIARQEGAKQNTKKTFLLIFSGITMMTLVAYAVFGWGAYWAARMYFGEKINAIRDYLILYGLGITAFTIAQAFVTYHIIKKQYLFAGAAFILSLGQIIALSFFHSSLDQIVEIMTIVGISHLIVFALLHYFYHALVTPLTNFRDFIDLFRGQLFNKNKVKNSNSLRILIFNWRDTKHIWGGGAEVYIQQVAKRLVVDGHRVTVFCGNDGLSPRNEVIDGVQIVRRGGFYTVYFWAFIYYISKFRDIFDVIIDSENGIPFLTPLFAKQPVFLLIHHIHQEVFRTHLKFPLKEIAIVIERDIMPTVYRNSTILTVSPSSKKEILALSLGTPESINVINPGIDLSDFNEAKKTNYPSICYIGRLKSYKNIDIALQAFAGILQSYPTAIFKIAGSGEMLEDLQKATKTLNIEKSVEFLGAVTNQEKADLLAQSWVAVQPSMVEGWGITVIEANASGTPVIASNVNGLKDSVKNNETGILVKPRDIKELGEALEAILGDSTYRKKLSANAVIWSRQFSWDNSMTLLMGSISQKIKQHLHQQSRFKIEAQQST